MSDPGTLGRFYGTLGAFMGALKQLSLLALMAAASACQSNVRLDPRWLDQPAWMDIEAASVVALGTPASRRYPE